MARARNIKPAFFKNEDLADIPHGARLLYIGLWTLADKNGLLEFRPKRIRAELFPYEHDVDVNGYITVLERLGNLQVLTDGENEFLYIPTFKEHQNPHHTEKTNLPDPKSLNLNVSRDLTVKTRLCNRYNLADSLITDSLITDSLITDSAQNDLSEFDEFWENYPRKVGKKKSEAIFKKLKRAEKDAVLACVNSVAFIRFMEKQVRNGSDYRPHPATWLNRGGWEDDYTGTKQASELERFMLEGF